MLKLTAWKLNSRKSQKKTPKWKKWIVIYFVFCAITKLIYQQVLCMARKILFLSQVSKIVASSRIRQATLENSFLLRKCQQLPWLSKSRKLKKYTACTKIFTWLILKTTWMKSKTHYKRKKNSMCTKTTRSRNSRKSWNQRNERFKLTDASSQSSKDSRPKKLSLDQLT